MNSLQLHRDLVQHFAQLGLKASKPQHVNLALLCQALAVSPNCHLATLAVGLPLPGHRENLVQRLRRFLKNDLAVADCYEPWVRHLFSHWSGREVSLVMDRTDIEDRWSILTLGATYRHRLLPLAWEVLPFGGTSAEHHIALVKQVQPHLPALAQVRVTFFGDCEFRAVPLQQACQALGWHWQVGLKSDLYFRPADGDWQCLRALNLQPGERRFVNTVFLTQDHGFGPVNLIADWSPHQETPRYWALDQTADRAAWRRGRKRYWIEPTHRDWKSYGFDLERSQLDDAERLSVLMLAINITTLWMIHLGDALIRSGHTAELAPRHKTDYGVFRLGRDYVRRCVTLNHRVPVGFTVQHQV